MSKQKVIDYENPRIDFHNNEVLEHSDKRNIFNARLASFTLFFIFAALFYIPQTILADIAVSADEKAKKMIERSEAHTRGDSFQAEVAMTVHNGETERNLSFRTWLVGRDKAVIKILSPVKDRDTGNLRLEMNLWQFLPNIDRVVKIPPSMMLQSWMGSDFTNDDLVKSSSLSRDYTHQIEKTETLGGLPAVKIICTPKADAPVAWGKVIVWLRETDSVPLKQEFYSENKELIKVMEGSDIKSFGSHTIPTQLVMSTVKKQGAKTILRYRTVAFDQKLDEKIFTQEYIRKPVKN
jgi:outer membrane lipoprotein-sorting protein